jgi:hypothetical protein
VGPYDELVLGQPVNFDGMYYMHVSKIFVSTVETLVNGRQPKELATFNVTFSQNSRRLDFSFREKVSDRLIFSTSMRLLSPWGFGLTLST